MKRKTITIKDQAYHITRQLGRGAYAKVYEVNNQDGQCFAIKKFKYDRKEGATHDMIRELDILSRFYDCPHILSIRGYKWTKTDCFVLMEHGGSNLRAFINCTDFRKRLELFTNITWQLLRGIHFLHMHNIAHRDIKPENILVRETESKTIKLVICDFGIAKHMMNVHNTPKITTLWYRAPENLLKMTKYSHNVDSWSIGCVLHEFLYGNALFRGISKADMLQKICNLLGSPSTETIQYFESHGANIQTLTNNHSGSTFEIKNIYDKLIFSMLCIDPRDRPSISDILDQPIFEKYKKLAVESTVKRFSNGSRDYLSMQNANLLNVFYRQHVVNSIFDICKEFRLSSVSCFMSIDLFDRFLYIHEIKSEKDLGFIVLACVNIANKYYEINSLEITNLQEMHSKFFGRDEKYHETFAIRLYATEKQILSAMNFCICYENIYTVTKDYDVAKLIVNDYELHNKKNLRDIAMCLNMFRKFTERDIKKLMQIAF